MTFGYYLLSVSQCNHHETCPKVVPVLDLIFPRLVQEIVVFRTVVMKLCFVHTAF